MGCLDCLHHTGICDSPSLDYLWLNQPTYRKRVQEHIPNRQRCHAYLTAQL
jgi:hypothetical protein